MTSTMKDEEHPVCGKAIKDPGKIYAEPHDVMNDARLSDEEKKKILESWSLDMEALLRAEEENMTKLAKPRYSADERFREIQTFLRQLNGEA